MPTNVPLPARTSERVPLTNTRRATALVYTLVVAAQEEVESVRDYYAKILPFYEKESAARTHLTFWRAMVRSCRPERILEIGSGLGRITSELARHAPAFGIDLSLEMLSAARLRVRRSRGGEAAPGFAVADMREVNFAPVFDLIVAPSDPFSHLLTMAERRRALSAVAAQLSRDGRFVLEGLYRRRRETTMPRRRVRYEGGVLEIEEAWFPVGVGDLWHARYRYRDRRPRHADRTLAAAFVARSWDVSRLRRLFRSCGLRIEALWGDFDRTPFARSASRLLIVARSSAAARRAAAVDFRSRLRSSMAELSP